MELPVGASAAPTVTTGVSAVMPSSGGAAAAGSFSKSVCGTEAAYRAVQLVELLVKWQPDWLPTRKTLFATLLEYWKATAAAKVRPLGYILCMATCRQLLFMGVAATCCFLLLLIVFCAPACKQASLHDHELMSLELCQISIHQLTGVVVWLLCSA